jgi:ATP-dependent RNA helicase RhlB
MIDELSKTTTEPVVETAAARQPDDGSVSPILDKQPDMLAQEDVNVADPETEMEAESESDEVDLMSFDTLELHENLLAAINGCGFSHCTPIQEETLPISLTGVDLIGKAQTGTGKTAAFLITAFELLLRQPIDIKDRFAGEPRVLIIAPTRELAYQIEKDAKGLNVGNNLNIFSVVGGMDYDSQQYTLNNYVVDILVATPGRLIDFLNKDDVFLDQVELLILDEADRMLDMGFIPDIKRILRRTTPREERQTLLFSATFNQDVLNLASQWTINAEYIEIETDSVAADTVEQKVYLVSASQKKKHLMKFLENGEAEKVIIFTNRRDQARNIEEYIRRNGINSALLTGDVVQSKRLKVLEQFKSNKVRVLVATDVAGRGLHIAGVSHVVNYNLPDDPEDYVHRIGRTGRAGSAGIAVTFACEDEAFSLPEIEKYIGRKLECIQPDSL